MNIAIFGGTFDPIHAGHLAAARAAQRRFRLDRILFIPTGNPPHKIHDHLTDYAQRYAMVAVACAGEPRFIPSTIEAPTVDGSPRYSIDTVRAVRRKLRQHDRLFFLVGRRRLSRPAPLEGFPALAGCGGVHCGVAARL